MPLTLGTLGRIIGAAAALVVGLAREDALAQSYPERPIRILIPFAAGNVLENTMRSAGERLKETTGQPVVVEARPGGAGIVAVQALLAAPADGYTTLLATQGILVINPHIFRSVPYKLADFTPVSLLYSSPMLLATHPSVPARDLSAFVAWAKANPGKVSYGSIAPGTVSHFLSEQLNTEHGTGMTHVPYKGSPALLPDLLAGRVQAGFVSVETVRAQVLAGKLNAIALSGAARSAQLPNVPTVREAGFASLEAMAWSGIVVRSETPAPIVERLAGLLRGVHAVPAVRAAAQQNGQQVVATPPGEFAARLPAESARWERIVKATGFSADE